MANDFYDRNEEIALLASKFAALEKGQMLVIYGRRRVGKTELIKQFMNSVKAEKLYFYVDLGGRQEILNSLSASVQDQLKENIKFDSFDSFLDFISNRKEKFILVIDEFQRFLDVAPEFITKLQNKWDSMLKNKKIMIILVGSSIGMIQKITESKAGALYGRASKIKISPFRYADFRLMFKSLSEEEKITRYAVFGGTPYYLEKAKNIHDIIDAINELVLKRSGELAEEPKNLLEYENVRVHAHYNSILHAISSGKEIMKEIEDFTKIKKNIMPAYFKRLDELLDLVGRNDPIFGKERLGRYEIKDNFFKFWYKFIFSNQTALNLGNNKIVLDLIKNNINAYVGRIFENIVKQLLILYQNEKIKGVEISFEDIGSWWDRNSNEIDIVAVNKREKNILFGEVKWTKETAGIEILNELIRKSNLVKFSGKYQYLLVSKSGFTDECLKKMKEFGALHLDLKEIEKLFDSK